MTNITPYTKNAKKHPKKQVEQIANSIKEFGMNQPIVVDSKGEIIVGHGRFLALQHLGWDIKPEWVIKKDDLTDEQVRAYRLADNKLNESDWDMSLVIEELKGLSEPMLVLTGFDSDLILEPDAKDNDVPEIPETPRSALGDVYELEYHRVMCGDATSYDDMEKLMNGRKADMWLTDPPYNVDYTGKTKDALKIDNDKKDDGEFRQFLTDAYTMADAYMKGGAVFYIWHADSEGYNFRGAAHDIGWKVRQCLIWNKQTLVMGRQDYHWKHEPCLYGWKEGTHLWNSDRTQTTVLEFDRPSRSTQHPTMKPVSLLVYQMTNNTKQEDIVLDSFLGSGSTLIAAEKTGRTCYGMELDPKYMDVIVQRWVDHTGCTMIIKNGQQIVWEKTTKETT